MGSRVPPHTSKEQPAVSPPVALDFRALFEGMMRHIPEGITIATAPDVKIIKVSRFGQETLGRSETELTGKAADDHPEQWDIYLPDGVSRPTGDQLPLTRATVKGETIINEPWVLRRPDGTVIHILCNAGPIRDESGEIQWGIIAWRDVTALHEAENALEEERQRNRSYRETLLQETAHRIKNNLAFIASMLRFQARRADSEKAKRSFEETAERMVALGRLYDRWGHEPNDVTSASEFFRHLAGSLESALSQPRRPVAIQVYAEACELPSPVAFDLGMIVNELVTNACKYGLSGDGSCSIQIAFRSQQQLAELIVADGGPGLPPGFDPHEAQTLGMIIIRSLASRLNADVSVERGAGARFRLQFPVEPFGSS
jgi:PAS domain S-box-containing protein